MPKEDEIKRLEEAIRLEQEFVKNGNPQPHLSATRISNLHYKLGKLKKEVEGVV